MNTNTMEMVTRRATWETVGTDVSKCQTLDEVLKEAKLDYKVVYRPITVEGATSPNERWQAIVRESDNHVYNMAKKSYTICQNEEAFSLINEMPEDFKVVRAGETPSGMIYLIGELPEVSILGDKFTPHLIFQNSHTSDFSLRVATVPLRVVCSNQFNIAFSEAANSHTIKHTASINSQIAEANLAMRNVVEYMQTLERKAEMMAANKVSIDKVEKLLFPIPENATERTENGIIEAREIFRKLYDSDDNQNFKGTAWGIINAATDYATHHIGNTARSKAENRFVNSILYPDFTRNTMKILAAV